MALRILSILVAIAILTACTTENTTSLITGESTNDTESARIVSGPTLIEPVDGAVIDSLVDLKLQWDWVRPLENGETYDVRIWREGEEAQSIAWSYETTFDLTNWMRFQPPGEFLWSVAVLQGEGGVVSGNITEQAPPARFSVRDTRLPGDNVLQTPDGFNTLSYGRLLEGSMPTAITFGPGDNLYVLTLEGNLYRMVNDDGEGPADTIDTVFRGAAWGIHHAVGIAFDGDSFYLSDSGRISRVDDVDGDGIYDTFTPLVENLPSLEYIDHSNNGIAVGTDGKLYIAIGATSDHGPLENPLEAAILRMDTDGNNLEVFASGLRNPYDLVFSPNGDLFAVDNSPDQISKTLPYLPPEELNHIREGRNYGFPDTYGRVNPSSGTEMPVTEFFTSIASAGMTYYAADAFPEAYQNGIFVAQWGTAAEAPLERGLNNGRQVVFVTLTPTDDGTYTGDWETFANFNQSLGDFRPIDVTVGPDGALYIAEWNTATIYRVTYTGTTAEEPTEMAVMQPTDTDSPPEFIALGEAIYNNGAGDAPACIACHSLDPAQRRLGPTLLDLAGRRANEDTDLADYVRTSILEPDLYVTQGYRAGYMYQHYREHLSDNEIDALVAYVLSIAQ